MVWGARRTDELAAKTLQLNYMVSLMRRAGFVKQHVRQWRRSRPEIEFEKIDFKISKVLPFLKLTQNGNIFDDFDTKEVRN